MVPDILSYFNVQADNHANVWLHNSSTSSIPVFLPLHYGWPPQQVAINFRISNHLNIVPIPSISFTPCNWTYSVLLILLRFYIFLCSYNEASHLDSLPCEKHTWERQTAVSMVWFWGQKKKSVYPPRSIPPTDALSLSYLEILTIGGIEFIGVQKTDATFIHFHISGFSICFFVLNTSLLGKPINPWQDCFIFFRFISCLLRPGEDKR